MTTRNTIGGTAFLLALHWTNTCAAGDIIRQEDIPALYATDSIDFEDKIIYQRYHFPIYSFRAERGMLYDLKGFNWLLAELDREEETAFGWANLNDDQNAEWGYAYLPEVESIGAVRDRNWIPLFFPEARKLVYGYLEQPGTKAHRDWWVHEHMDFLKSEYSLVSPKPDFNAYADKLYKLQFKVIG